MELTIEQKRIIKSKCNGHKLIKGNAGSGKTTAVINKIPSIINSYCVENDDKVLVVSQNDEQSSKISSIYNHIEVEKYRQSSFFDNDINDKLVIKNIDDIITNLFNSYKKNNKFDFNIATESDCLEVLNIAIENSKAKFNLMPKYKKIKFLYDTDVSFIRNEIRFMKESNYENINQYQKGYCGDYVKLRKNSKQREILFSVFEEYNKCLSELGLIDNEDIALIGFREAMNKNSEKYTHIIIDEVQNLSKIKLDILRAIYNEKQYSSILFILDNDKIEYSNGWINKKRTFKTLGYNMTGKCTNFKHIFNNENNNFNVKGKENIMSNIINNEDDRGIEPYQYIDLNRKICHEFFVDSSSINDVYTGEDNFNKRVTELIDVPVYNEIAAGSPILMNDEFERSCYLPKEWIRSDNKVFMLKIKGDSMIKRNINDGDYVVINKQKYPVNHDIVAVEIEGEATLKTFKNKGKQIILVPENDSYEPIVLDGNKECSLLGVAVGLIKGMY